MFSALQKMKWYQILLSRTAGHTGLIWICGPCVNKPAQLVSTPSSFDFMWPTGSIQSYVNFFFFLHWIKVGDNCTAIRKENVDKVHKCSFINSLDSGTNKYNHKKSFHSTIIFYWKCILCLCLYSLCEWVAHTFNLSFTFTHTLSLTHHSSGSDS